MYLAVRSYCRPFYQPLRTAHGPWGQRAGLLLRFEDERGQVGFGEVAPLPWFGTETLAAARDFCDRWPQQFSPTMLNFIPDTLPACQFGFSAVGPHPKSLSQAWERDLPLDDVGNNPCDICALLPTAAAALAGWQALWQAGHRTLKWKIGVAAVEEELSIFRQLTNGLPSEACLRLDANGGLTPEIAASWLAACDRAPIQIEFLEQPLAPEVMLDWLPKAKGQYRTAIALDESVATFQQLQQVYERVGNQVIYVLKSAIAGWPHRLLDFCLHHQLDVVLSSALETPIGRDHALRLAQMFWAKGIAKRALGFGVAHWFVDNWEVLSPEAIWQQL
ncbi:MAG: o-succinylbenzoate synthase [Cyanobacteria bacterium P01_F01_bin.56]